MKISRILSSASTAAATVALGLGLGAVPATAAAPAIAIQGHLIQTADGAQCSIGYVEPTRAWTASHCGFNGQAVYNEHGSHIGTLRYLHREGAQGQDVAYIQYAVGTVAGGNPVTGDGIGGVPALGTTVCVTGNRTGENCASVEQRPQGIRGMYSTGELFKNHGDSGSAGYVPGQSGVVGIYTGTVTFTNDQGQSVYEDLAAMPSQQERDSLPYQGFVARKPDLTRTASLNEFPSVWARQYQEPLEAIVFLIQRGATFDDLRGILGALGVLF